MKVRVNKNKVNNGITLVNYADELFTQSQQKNTKTALKIGGVKKVFSFGREDIEGTFYAKNKLIFDQKRGGGYWLWKPYVIKKALSEIADGEFLFYCDSGSVFVNVLDHLITSFDVKFDIMPFELQKLEYQYTKRDCFCLLGCDEKTIIETKQILAVYSLWRKSEFTMKFVEDWLTFAQDLRLITDIDNELGLPNYDGFIEHRHDQSIFSLLIKKNNIKVYRDPSQFGIKFAASYPDSTYPQIVESTRQKNISFLESVQKELNPDLIVKKIYFFVRKIIT